MTLSEVLLGFAPQLPHVCRTMHASWRVMFPEGGRRHSHGSGAPCVCMHPQVEPKGDLVLVEVASAETKSTGGVLLPSAAQRKPTSGRRRATNHSCMSCACCVHAHYERSCSLPGQSWTVLGDPCSHSWSGMCTALEIVSW